MAAVGVAICGYFGDEGEGFFGSTMGWFRCGNCVSVVASSCGRNTVLLRVFLVIWIHAAIAAGCGCGPRRNRNIAAASTDAVHSLNHWLQMLCQAVS